jgi:aldose sugar dehydrogenase
VAGHWFAGALMEARMPGTGHIQRIVFNQHGEQRREALLRELRQRVRDVKQGPDGLIYVLTEEANGALLRLEPAH